MPPTTPRPGEAQRHEMADQQRQAAAAVRDSIERSALVLAAEVLEPHGDDDAELGSAGYS